MPKKKRAKYNEGGRLEYNIKNNIGNAEFAVAFLQKQISEMRKQMAQNIEK